MDKKAFLEELRKHLSVLEDREIDDLIGEYAQHIDMKVKEGLSEEAATAEFGNVEELCAEILEAYHVKPDYREAARAAETEAVSAEKKRGLPFLKGSSEKRRAASERGKETLKHAGGRVAAGAEKGKETAAGLFGKAAAGVRSGAAKCKDAFSGLVSDVKGGTKSAAFAAGRTTGTVFAKAGAFLKTLLKKLFAACGVFCRKLWVLFCMALDACRSLLIWALRACWYLFWVCMAAFTGGFGLLCLFGFGLFLVFWILGYPFAGFSLLSLGGALLSGGITMLLFSFRRLGKAGKTQKCGRMPAEVPDGLKEMRPDASKAAVSETADKSTERTEQKGARTEALYTEREAEHA